MKPQTPKEWLEWPALNLILDDFIYKVGPGIWLPCIKSLLAFRSMDAKLSIQRQYFQEASKLHFTRWI